MIESPVSILHDENGNAVTVAQDGTVYRLLTSTAFTERSSDIVHASFVKLQVPSTQYYCVIDLDNQGGAGPYKHNYSAGQWLSITSASCILVKSKAADDWDAKLGIILRVDGIDSDIGWFPGGTLHARDTGRFESTTFSQSFNSPLSLEVSGEDLTKIALGYKELNVASINTGMTLEDLAGNAITPGVGDVITEVTRTEGTGTADTHYGIGYLVG